MSFRQSLYPAVSCTLIGWLLVACVTETTDFVDEDDPAGGKADGACVGCPVLQPLLGAIPGTTPEADFSAEELTHASKRLPRSVAIASPVGATITLGPSPARGTYRSVTLTDAGFGNDLEICARSTAASTKLWIYRTEEVQSANCDKFRCNKPMELDETRLSSVGEEVCTRGRLRDRGPYYVVVETQPALADVTVRSRRVSIPFAPTVNDGEFAACGSAAALPQASLRHNQPMGSFVSKARDRECNRFRGCSSWGESFDEVRLWGTCDSCIPRVWENDAASGTIYGHEDNSGKRLALLPAGAVLGGPRTNTIQCKPGVPWCGVAGSWKTHISLGVRDLYFAGDLVINASCLRTIARSTGANSASSFGESEVVFRGSLQLP